MRKRFIYLLLLGLAASLPLSAQDGSGNDDPGMATFRTRALTPPMGWNSWDCYYSCVTEKEAMQNARYLPTPTHGTTCKGDLPCNPQGDSTSKAAKRFY